MQRNPTSGAPAPNRSPPATACNAPSSRLRCQTGLQIGIGANHATWERRGGERLCGCQWHGSPRPAHWPQDAPPCNSRKSLARSHCTSRQGQRAAILFLEPRLDQQSQSRRSGCGDPLERSAGCKWLRGLGFPRKRVRRTQPWLNRRATALRWRCGLEIAGLAATTGLYSARDVTMIAAARPPPGYFACTQRVVPCRERMEATVTSAIFLDCAPVKWSLPACGLRKSPWPHCGPLSHRQWWARPAHQQAHVRTHW